MLWLLVFLSLLKTYSAQSKQNISIILMSEYDSYKVAMEEAVKDINNRDDILRDYTLDISSVVTYDCNVGEANFGLFNALYSPPVKLMVIGNGCSDICLQTGAYLPKFNLCQISYQAASADFVDRDKYPQFFRTLHSNTAFIRIRLAFMEEFKWNKVASVIVDSPLNDQLTSKFEEALRKTNKSLVLSEKFRDEDDFPHIINKLKDHQAKIIFASFIDKVGAFCEIYNNKLFGPQYVWFISTFVDGWWNVTKPPCGLSEFKTALEGSFNMIYTRKQGTKETSLSGKDKDSIQGDELQQAAYDAVWVAGVALDQTAKDLKSSNGKRLEDFYYNDSLIGNKILENVKKVNFQGVSEYIAFNSEGNVKVDYVIHQFINGQAKVVGYLREGNTDISWENDIQWRGGFTPSDTPEKVYTVDQTPTALTGVVCFINAIILLAAIGFLIFNVHLLQSRIALMNINMDTIFLLGIFFIVISIFIESSQITPSISSCIAFRFLFFIGFSLSVGSLTAKIWRIHVICLDAYASVSEIRLFILIGLYLITNLIVLIIRESAHPSDIYFVSKSREYVNGYEYITKTGYCDSPNGVYYRATFVSIQGFVLLFSSYLAWVSRKASFPGMRDARVIGFCLFTILILSIAGVGIGIFVENQKIDFAIKSFCILAAVVVSTSFIFITKIRHYRSGKLQLDDEENPQTVKPKETTTAAPKPPVPNPTLETTMTVGLDEISKVIEERNKAIDNMRSRIEGHQNAEQV